MSKVVNCRIGLPENFRAHDVLAFHGRDAQQIAERVVDHGLHKGLVWRAQPACLRMGFGAASVDVQLSIDGDASGDDARMLEGMVVRMLGLMQPVSMFEQAYHAHPELGQLVARNAGLRVSLTPTPFEALAWAIVGQLISVSAAVSIRRRVIQAAGISHSSGIACFPDAARIAAMSEQRLLDAGLSRTKARALLTLSQMVEDGSLPVNDWAAGPAPEKIGERLLAIRGIGPWTVNYVLLRGFGFLDGSLHGDVAVRRNLQALLGRPERIDENEAKQWLAQFSPWRALVAAHLWAMKKAEGY
jgi:DNA-3-methyladenine glycosylase II